jgi:hypothetical protein
MPPLQVLPFISRIFLKITPKSEDFNISIEFYLLFSVKRVFLYIV